MTDGLTREELHQELAVLRQELDQRLCDQRRWRWNNVFTPEMVGRFAVTAAVVIVGAAGLWFTLQNSVSNNSDDIERNRLAQIEADARLDKRIDDERTERAIADNRVENRTTQAVNELKDLLKETNRDIKSILRALPRSPVPD